MFSKPGKRGRPRRGEERPRGAVVSPHSILKKPTALGKGHAEDVRETRRRRWDAVRGRKRKPFGRINEKGGRKAKEGSGSDSEASSAFWEGDGETDEDEESDEDEEAEDEENGRVSDGEERRKRMVKRGVNVANAFDGMDDDERDAFEKENSKVIEGEGEEDEEDGRSWRIP